MINSVPKPKRKCRYCDKIILKGKYCNVLCQQKMGKRRLKARRKSLLHESDLDPIWSRKVKELADFQCEKCESTHNLNSHHVYGRINRTVRWDVDNGFCLCAGCHKFSTKFSAHETPTLFTEWIKKERGQEWYDNLTTKAMGSVHVTQDYYQQKLAELNANEKNHPDTDSSPQQ